MSARRSSLGALAVSGASAVRLTFQLALLPILARLIGPSEYGLVALAMPFILLANVVADGGLVVALGRQKEASPAVESTAFWIAALIGAALALVTCAAAWPISLAMREPKLTPLILALSPILLMNSLTVVSNGRIIRERKFALFAGGDLISTVAGAATALLAATHGWGAWSLIAQQLVLWVCKLAWVTAKAGAKVRLMFRFGEVREILAFGANNLGATLADYVSRNVDNMIVGAVLGATSLGYYAMAYQLIRIPDMLISGPFYYYIFTALSRAAHAGDRRAIRDLAKGGLRVFATLLAPLFCGLALVADLAVGVVLGPEWTGAIGALRWLSAAGFGFCMCSVMAAMLTGLGRAGLQFRLAVALSLATVVTVGGAVRFGLEPVAAALACGVALVCGYYLDQLARDLKAARLSLLAGFAPAAVGCSALTAAVFAVRELLAGHAPWVVFLAALAAGAVAYAAVIWGLARRRLLADARAYARVHSDAAHLDQAEREIVTPAQAEAALSPAG
jgi:PST family polysaccharide transporter